MLDILKAKVLKIAGKQVASGHKRSINIPVPRLYTHTEMTMPVHILRGKKDGPRLFVCAAIHGDEIIGVEIIRRLLKLKILQRLRGTLIAFPVVNVYGFINHTRYLPDRRDLNRFFPGSEKGSLTSRLANIFMEEIVAKSTSWVRAPGSGILRTQIPLGGKIAADQKIAEIADPFDEHETAVISSVAGIVIGRMNLPLVHKGDALFHVAGFEDSVAVSESLNDFKEEISESIPSATSR